MNAPVTAPTVEREGDTLVIRVPMRLKQRGGRTEVIVPEGLPGATQAKDAAQEPLVTALARAFHWQELLESGRYASVTELAAALDVDRSYVGRILRLTCLAPDIVEAIVEGREPSGLSLERLVKGLPVVWELCRCRHTGRSSGRGWASPSPNSFACSKTFL